MKHMLTFNRYFVNRRGRRYFFSGCFAGEYFSAKSFEI